MESAEPTLFIGNRLSEFQAAAACLSAGPKLRAAGTYCMWVGGFVLVYLLVRSSIASVAGLEYLALFAFGLYLYSPSPRPWAMPAAGLIILGILGQAISSEYQYWRISHHAAAINPAGLLVEAALGVTLFAGYFSYRKNLSATDPGVLDELRAFARAVNKADPKQDTGIVEMIMKKHRVRLRRVEDLLLIVERHHIAFNWYSRLDAVSLVKPQDFSLAVTGGVKPNRAVKLQLSLAGKKGNTFKVEPQYLPRLANLGVAVSGLAEASPRPA